MLYIGDWFKDGSLRQATVVSRGIWIDILLFMWGENLRGLIKTTPLRLMKLTGSTLDEVMHFLNEIYDLEFGDIKVDENVTFPINETQCNINVTLINRRMYADYKNKQNTRLRVRKHRETKKKQKCNTDLTLTSSLAVSLAVSKNNQQADFFRNTIHPYFTSIERNALLIYNFKDRKSFNPFAWVNNQFNKKKAHPGAVDYTLQQMTIYWEKIDNPNGYATGIMKKENGNFNEREYIEDHEQVKKDYADFIENSEELKNIIGGIGNEPSKTT